MSSGWVYHDKTQCRETFRSFGQKQNPIESLSVKRKNSELHKIDRSTGPCRSPQGVRVLRGV